MKLLDLPNELLTYIANFLDDEFCINAFLQTCKRLYLLLNNSLYQLNVRNSHACALEWAAKNGYEKSARHILEAGASPNASVFEEWLPMALACIHGHETVVRLLMNYEVDPSSTESWLQEPSYESQSGDEGCPLILAAGRGHESVVRLLISHGVHPDIRSSRVDDVDLSGLAIAARNGHLLIVKLLINLGCDPYIRGWFGSNILADAAHEGHFDVVHFLLEKKPEIESPGIASSALAMAAKQGHADIVDLLLEHGKSPTHFMTGYPLEPLIWAVKKEHYLIVENLRLSMDLCTFVAHSETDGEDQRQLLMISAAYGWNCLVENLLRRGCSTEFLHTNRFLWSVKENPALPRHLNLAQYPSPLALAAHRDHFATVKLLLNCIPNQSMEQLLNGRDPTPLLLAIDGRHKPIINMLLDNGANPNHLTDGRIPVFFKAVDATEIIKLLFDQGANPELEADRPFTTYRGSVYVQALAVGNLSTVEFLRRLPCFKESTPAKNSSQLSVLQAAAHGGALIMENLLESGYQVLPGSHEVAEALRIVLSKADHATLALLFERKLIGNLVSIGNTNIMALVDSPDGDLVAMSATLDMLLAHGIRIEIEEQDKSPLHDLFLRQEKVELFKLLLNRGADPLRKKGQYGDTLLAQASKTGNKELVRIMLKSLDGRSIPLGKLQAELARAKYMAELGLESIADVDVRPLLRRFYWRKRYLTQPTKSSS
ncbi:hypothetical protein N7509_011475 [Penicillium cosmopolitanum]|uniref:F-box domain-containing protein n=1 Tax=Penicillium cosmopolitanum TaxID=1131564 RepID=A0A9W9VGC4_9EURO|nr:uncharacterized protein N7509_011475 [Penicillium cosmopolitanum]KAJ5378356.1 hypothetical protein N7509_011475 [Penicillium cosmopolitanum]